MPEKNSNNLKHDIAHGNVATRFRCAGTFEYYFIQFYCKVCFEIIFKSVDIWKG